MTYVIQIEKNIKNFKKNAMALVALIKTFKDYPKFVDYIEEDFFTGIEEEGLWVEMDIDEKKLTRWGFGDANDQCKYDKLFNYPSDVLKITSEIVKKFKA